MTLNACRNPRVAFPAFEAGGCLLREGCFREFVHSWQVFVSGRVSVGGECLSGDDSNAYDRSFA